MTVRDLNPEIAKQQEAAMKEQQREEKEDQARARRNKAQATKVREVYKENHRISISDIVRYDGHQMEVLNAVQDGRRVVLTIVHPKKGILNIPADKTQFVEPKRQG